MTRFAQQLDAARRAYEAMSPDERDDIRDGLAAELAAQYRDDPEKLREAEEFESWGFQTEHWQEMAIALHALHHTDPDNLMGSQVLTNLYQVAKAQATAMDERLLAMAYEELDRRDAAAPTAADARMECE